MGEQDGGERRRRADSRVLPAEAATVDLDHDGGRLGSGLPGSGGGRAGTRHDNAYEDQDNEPCPRSLPLLSSGEHGGSVPQLP